jgi:hypothetical protein
MRPVMVLLAVLSTTALCFGATAEFRVKDVSSATALDTARLEPGTVAFSDHRGDELTDPATGLHMYVAEARFAVAKPPSAIDLARYTTPAFLEKIDPSITHRTIAAADAVPNKDPENPYNKRPDRRWCEGVARPVCIESRYQLEGKLPMGVRLANKLEEGDKKIAETVDFQSELRVLSPQEIDQAGLAKLTGLDAPVTGVLEQSTFHVNQIMRFGKFLAVFQKHPSDPNRTIATAFMALGVKSSVLERKKEFERVPILRNLVPAQVLMGASSFNTGTSISAGLPKYTRNRIEAIAGILERE